VYLLFQTRWRKKKTGYDRVKVIKPVSAVVNYNYHSVLSKILPMVTIVNIRKLHSFAGWFSKSVCRIAENSKWKKK